SPPVGSPLKRLSSDEPGRSATIASSAAQVDTGRSPRRTASGASRTMSMTSMVVLGLSIAPVLHLLGAFLATLRQDRRERTAAEQPVVVAPAEPPLPAPVAAAAHAGTDYIDPRTLRVGDKIEVLGSPVRVLGAVYVSWQGQQWVEYRLRDSARR